MGPFAAHPPLALPPGESSPGTAEFQGVGCGGGRMGACSVRKSSPPLPRPALSPELSEAVRIPDTGLSCIGNDRPRARAASPLVPLTQRFVLGAFSPPDFQIPPGTPIRRRAAHTWQVFVLIKKLMFIPMKTLFFPQELS